MRQEKILIVLANTLLFEKIGVTLVNCVLLKIGIILINNDPLKIGIILANTSILQNLNYFC